VTRWDFDVNPLRRGFHYLRLLVSIRIKIRGKDEVVDLPSYEKEIAVGVAPAHALAHFSVKNWQWMAGTIIIPLLVWIGKITGLGSIAIVYLHTLFSR
jgi:hypothetical protein